MNSSTLFREREKLESMLLADKKCDYVKILKQSHKVDKLIVAEMRKLKGEGTVYK